MKDELRTWLNNEVNQRGWTYSELARRSDISQSLLSKTLAGTKNTSPQFCIKVAAALGEAPEKVLRLAGILPTSPASEDDPTLAEIQDILKNLSPRQRKETLRFLRYLYQDDNEE